MSQGQGVHTHAHTSSYFHIGRDSRTLDLGKLELEHLQIPCSEPFLFDKKKS